MNTLTIVLVVFAFCLGAFFLFVGGAFALIFWLHRKQRNSKDLFFQILLEFIRHSSGSHGSKLASETLPTISKGVRCIAKEIRSLLPQKGEQNENASKIIAEDNTGRRIELREGTQNSSPKVGVVESAAMTAQASETTLLLRDLAGGQCYHDQRLLGHEKVMEGVAEYTIEAISELANKVEALAEKLSSMERQDHEDFLHPGADI